MMDFRRQPPLGLLSHKLEIAFWKIETSHEFRRLFRTRSFLAQDASFIRFVSIPSRHHLPHRIKPSSPLLTSSLFFFLFFRPPFPTLPPSLTLQQKKKKEQNKM